MMSVKVFMGLEIPVNKMNNIVHYVYNEIRDNLLTLNLAFNLSTIGCNARQRWVTFFK